MAQGTRKASPVIGFPTENISVWCVGLIISWSRDTARNRCFTELLKAASFSTSPDQLNKLSCSFRSKGSRWPVLGFDQSLFATLNYLLSTSDGRSMHASPPAVHGRRLSVSLRETRLTSAPTPNPRPSKKVMQNRQGRRYLRMPLPLLCLYHMRHGPFGCPAIRVQQTITDS